MWKLTVTAGLWLIIASLVSSHRLVCNSLTKAREEEGEFMISDIDPNQCTHLIYAFSDINNQNELVPSSATDIENYQSFNGLKTRNPQLKTLLAVGGLTFDTQKFSRMVSENRNRAKFIQSAITLLRANKFDGLTIDWRYPGGGGTQPQDKERFTLLCKELKDAFVAEGTAANRDRLIITASVSADRATIDASYEVAKIAMYLDFINVLTFDFHGPWEGVAGHHSPLYRGSQDTGDKIYFNTESAMQYWRDQGTPTQKLNMGLAAYGRAFTLSSASSNVGAPANGPGEEGCYGEDGLWTYYEMCVFDEGIKTHMISDQKVPYITKGNLWVGFDNKDSLGTKVSYLKTNNFGGAFVWSMDLDDFSGQSCKQGYYPFISHLRNLLVPGYPTFVICPSTGKPCDGKTSGLECNPDDPGSFFNCDSQTAHLQHCPKGLVFNKSCNCCDWPTINITTPNATKTTTKTASRCEISTPPCTGKTIGHECNPKDPGSFYHCDGQRAHLKQCPAGLVFDSSIQVCVWPTIAITNPTDTTTTTPTPTTTTTTTTAAVGECKISTPPCTGKTSGHECNPKDRGSFYHCDGQRAHLKQCPAGLVFDSSIQVCVWPTIAITNPTDTTTITPTPTATTTTTTPTPTTTTTTTTAAVGECKISTPPCTGKTSGHECNPKDPGSFYHCDGQRAHLKQCPAGLVFDSSIQVCVWPTIAITNPTDTTTITPTPTATTTTTTPTPTTTTTTTTAAVGECKISTAPCTGKTSGHECNPKDRGSFYHCDGQRAHLKQCPAGLVFDSSIQVCVWPTIAITNPTDTTTTTPTPTATTTTTTALVGECKISTPPCTGKTSGHECNPKDRGSFYHCDGQRAHLKQCPAGLVFDSSIQVCVWPTIAITNPTDTTTITPTPTATTTTTTAAVGECKISTPPCTGKTSGHECNPKDPGSFYHCDGQRAHLKQCPAGLVFDSSIQVCVWPTIAITNPTVTTTITPTPTATTTTTTPTPTTTTTTTTAAVGECKISTPPCTGKTSGHECNPKDRGSFYHCDGQRAHLKQCPAGLVFDSSIQVCVWPIIAITNPTVTTTITPTPTATTTTTTQTPTTITTSTTAAVGECKISTPPCTGKTSGHECNPKDPGSFYHCDGQRAHLKQCPAGLVFDSSIQVCVWPTIAITNPTVTTTITPTPTATTTTTTTTQTPTTITTSTTAAVGECKISTPPCTGKTSGHECNPKDPGSFYHCDGQRAHLKQCPAGLVFDSSIQVCVWPTIAITNPTDTTTTTPTPTATTTTTTPTPTTTTTTTPAAVGECKISTPPCTGKTSGHECNPKDPGSFYHCDGQRAHLKQCPAGLVFDSSIQVCVWPTIAITNPTDTTTITPTPTATTTTTTAAVGECKISTPPCTGKTSGHECNPKDPGSFYHCDGQRAHLKQCPAGLVFDSSIQVCVWPTIAITNPTVTTTITPTPTATTTTTTPTPTTTTTTTTAAVGECKISTPPCTGKTSGHECNPKDRGSFYHCDGQRAHLKQCPAGLVFDSSIQVCVWPTIAITNPTVTTTITPTPTATTTTTTQTPTTITTSTTAAVGQCKISTPPCTGKTSGHECNPKDPGSFYHCDGQRAHLKQCPAGLVFDSSIQVCVWPTIAITNPTVTTTITPTPTATTTTTTQTPTTITTSTTAAVGECKISTPPCTGKTSGHECNPKDPGSFYHCDGQRAHLKQCPAGLVFDSSIQVCVWPTIAITNPTDTTTTTPTPTATTTTTTPTPTTITTSTTAAVGECKISAPPCTGKTSGHECNPKDRGSFYHCDGQKVHLKQCPAGLVFKKSCNCCGWPTIAIKTPTTTTTTTTTPTHTLTTTTATTPTHTTTTTTTTRADTTGSDKSPGHCTGCQP